MDEIRVPVSLGGDDVKSELKGLLESFIKAKDATKDGINVKVNVDTSAIKDLEKFKTQYTKFQKLNKQNKISKYYANEENALKSLTSAWTTFQNARSKGKINEDNLTSESKATAVLRMANAYQALGYDISKINPEIKEFQEKMSGLMSIKSPDYDYTVDKFKEVFSQVPALLEDMTANGFDVSQIINGLKSIEEQAEKTSEAIKEANSSSVKKATEKVGFISDDKSSIPERMKELKYYHASLKECRKEMQALDDKIYDVGYLNENQLKDYVGYYQRLSELKTREDFTADDQLLLDNYESVKEDNYLDGLEKAEQELVEYKKQYIQNAKDIEAAEEELASKQQQRQQEEIERAEAQVKAVQEQAEAEKQAVLEKEEAERKKREAEEITSKYAKKTKDELISDLNSKYKGDANNSIADADSLTVLSGTDELKGIQKYSHALKDEEGQLSSIIDDILNLNNQLAKGIDESGEKIDPSTVEQRLNSLIEEYQETLDKIEVLRNKIVEETPVEKPKSEEIDDIFDYDNTSSEQAEKTAESVEKATEEFKEEAQAAAQSADAVEAAESSKQAATEKTREMIALTKEELEQQLKSNHTKSSFKDYHIFWDLGIDDELSDIEKWSKAVEKAIEARDEALNNATTYQNRFVNGESSKWISNETYGDWYKDEADNYLKYSDYLEHAQQRLQESLKTFKPSAEGGNAESINALVLLLQRLNEQIEQVSKAFGTIDDNANFQSLLSSINVISDSLTSMKSVFVDVGDGQEFSPLFSVFERIIASVEELKKAVSGIKLNINLDTSVNEEQTLMKIEGRKQDLLRAYQEQFYAMKHHKVGGSKLASSMLSGSAKYNSAEVSRLNKSIQDFDPDSYDNIEQKIKAYESIIERMKEVQKLVYGENIYDNMDKTYQREVTRAKSNLTRAQKSLGKNSTEEISNLFGSSDVSVLIPQLDAIIDKLQMMVDIAAEFAKVFNITIPTNNINENLELEAKAAEKVAEAEREKKAEQSKSVQPDTSVQEQHEREKQAVEEVIEAEKKLDDEQKNSGVKSKEISDMETLEQKVNAVKTAVNLKTDAFKEEEQVVASAVQREAISLEYLNKQLSKIIGAIEKLKKTPIELDIKSTDGKLNIKEFIDSLNGLDTNLLNNLNEVLRGLAIDESVATNIQRVANAILNLKSNLNNVSSNGNEFLNSIKELTSNAKALQNLADVLNATDDKLSRAKKAVEDANKSANPSTQEIEVQTESKEWEKVKTAALEYKNVLGDIQKITYSMRQDKDGKKLKSYKVIGSKSSITIGENLNVVAQKETQEYQKTAEDLLKIRNDFIEAANKAGVQFDLSSLSVDKNGIITFTSTVTEAGETAVETKYKIKDLYEAINDGALDKGYLNKNVVKSGTSGKIVKADTTDSKDSYDKEIAYLERINKLEIENITASKTKQVENNEEIRQLREKISLQQQFRKEHNLVTDVGDSRIKDKQSELAEVLDNSKKIKDAGKTAGIDENIKKEAEKASKAIDSLKSDITSLQTKLKGTFKGTDVNTQNFIDSLHEITENYQKLKNLNEQDTRIVSDKDIQGLREYILTFKDVIDRISFKDFDTTDAPDKFVNKLKEAEAQLVNVKSALKKVETGEAFTNEDIAKIKEFISHMRNLYDIAGNKENKFANTDTVNKYLKKIYKNLEENTAMSKEMKQSFKELASEMESFGGKIPLDEFNKLQQRFHSLDAEMYKSGRTGLSFFDGIARRAKSMSQSFISMYLSLWDIIRYIRTGLNYIKELDTAFTEMRKVSDETVQSLKNFQKASFDIASAVGTTAQQIQNSTADWMRLGESLKEATKSAEVSNILLNVSEFESIDEATESLVAMSAAYDELDKMEIIDKLNQVGNNFSISTDGLATALQRSASALVTAGNDMDEAVALVTAGNAVVQNPDSVGAGLRTIALRISGTESAREELEELGEDVDDFVVQTSAKSQQVIKDFTRVASNNFEGFDILDDNGNFKSTYDILLGISEIYEEIIETDRQYGSNMANGLLETLAGKNRANIAASILQNPQLLKDVYTSSQDSEGSAQQELDKYLDSIEGKIAQFQNEVQEFWYNLISSETIKVFVDAGTVIVDVLGDIVGYLGEIGTLATVAIGAFSVKSISNSGGRDKKFSLVIKYATESFSREVCEFWCISE